MIGQEVFQGGALTQGFERCRVHFTDAPKPRYGIELTGERGAVRFITPGDACMVLAL